MRISFVDEKSFFEQLIILDKTTQASITMRLRYSKKRSLFDDLVCEYGNLKLLTM